MDGFFKVPKVAKPSTTVEVGDKLPKIGPQVVIIDRDDRGRGRNGNRKK